MHPVRIKLSRPKGTGTKGNPPRPHANFCGAPTLPDDCTQESSFSGMSSSPRGVAAGGGRPQRY